jgi:hypothetical protein
LPHLAPYPPGSAAEYTPAPPPHLQLKKLSPDGRKLVDDIRDIIETARLMILTKNDDELFQNFVYHTQVTDVSRGAQGKEALPTSKDAVKNDAENAAVHLRTLLTLVFTNSEMRKVISDVSYPPTLQSSSFDQTLILLFHFHPLKDGSRWPRPLCLGRR